MTWIRDNLLKIVIILGVLIIVIIIVSLFAPSGKKTDVVEASGYEEIENKMQSAAINFLNDNKKFLPSSSDKSTTIRLDTLEKNRYIGSVYAIEDSSVKCKGEVVINKTSDDTKDYRIVPYISCGKYYTTRKIKDYILDNEKIVTSDDGLYKEGDIYRFKGEYPNNYILLGERKYRIISIQSDGSLKLMRILKTNSSYIWDDRYNSEVKKSIGINNYEKSRMKDNLYFILNNNDPEKGSVELSNEEKTYFLNHEFCNGALDVHSNEISVANECKTTITQRIGLANPSDYYLASVDSACTKMKMPECTNYNYMNKYDRLVLMNLPTNYSYRYLYLENSSLFSIDANRGNRLTIFVYIDGDNVYKSGNGTSDNPYVIR